MADTGTAVERIDAPASVTDVVPRPKLDQIRSTPPQYLVVTTEAADDVAFSRPHQAVVTFGADDDESSA